MSKIKKIPILSFFAGSGFLDLGFEDAGFDICYVNEFYEPFLDAYKFSRSKMGKQLPKYGFFYGSIDDCFNGKEYQKLQKILEKEKKINNNSFIGFIGGPPCPDFSIGGKNRGKNGDNGKLSQSYINLICELKPDFFIFENVKGLYRTLKHREFFDMLKRQLENSEYILTEKLINALEYGVPQNRDRIILFGIRKSLLKNNSISDFNWNKSIIYSKQEISSFNWPDIGKTDYDINTPKELTIEYWFNKNNVINHPNMIHVFNAKAGLNKFKTILEGDNKRKSFKRLHRYKFSPTAAYGNNEVHIHPTEPRRITAAEALAIQSLPQNFCLPPDMTLTNMFKTIGNGVPFLAAKGVADSVYDFLDKIIKSKTNKINC